jgi:Fe-coproporphyrin III synthase
VVFSGGEPLLHSNLFLLADHLREAGIRVTLLSTGQRLAELAEKVAFHTDDTILSLDGPELVHDDIRRVKGAFRTMVQGLNQVRKYRPDYALSCRTTVQRRNFTLLRQTLLAARSAGFDSISYLAADVASEAFNRSRGWNQARQRQVAVPRDEIANLEHEIEQLIREHSAEIESGFLRESPEKLRRIVHHFRVQCGEVQAIAPRCNAPWVSAVVEADGAVRPCFFHAPLGSIQDRSLLDVVNSSDGLRFREKLVVEENSICQRCVCSLYLER